MDDHRPLRRRQVLTLAAAGVLGLGPALAACSSGGTRPGGEGPGRPRRPIPAARPGRAMEMVQAPMRERSVVWTVDDGADADVVAAYVAFARASGTPLTFCPLPTYRAAWEPHADDLAAMVDAGQVQLVNHTWSHAVLTKLDDDGVRRELQRAEDWVQATFGVTARPYWRPPWGHKDRRVKRIAGELGYTRALMWNESFGDASPTSTPLVDVAVRRSLRPGAVMLSHANQPAIVPLLAGIPELARARGLAFTTPDRAWGTSRAIG